MGIRAIAVAFAITCVTTATTHAEPPPPSAAEQPAAPSEAVEAGRGVIRALVYDSGLMEAAIQPLLEQMMPALRQQVLQSPLYNSVSPRAQAALIAYLDTMPEFLRSSLRTEFENVADRAGIRLAERLTVDELNGIADFMRHPSSRAFLARLAADYVTDREANTAATPEELAYIEEFMTTPPGVALTREMHFVETVFQEEFEAGTARMSPQVRAAVVTGMCAALGNECPRSLREQVNRT
jgi:hypothetical protein